MAKPDQGSTPSLDDVEIDSVELSYDGFFKIHTYRFRHRLFAGGMSEPLSRELFGRGDAVIVLPYDPKRDEVVLIEQFRIGAFGSQSRKAEGRSPWMIECIAGMIDKGLSAEQTAHAEAREEAGLTLTNLELVMKVMPTPGGVSERFFIYVAEVDSTQAQGIHGLDVEGEDIRVKTVSRAQAYQWVENGVIDNAPTVIALQWLELHYSTWSQRAGKQSPRG